MKRDGTQDEIHALLAVGSRLAKGRVDEVVELVRPVSGKLEPRKLKQVVECLWDDDAGVANRAADVLERVTREDAKPLARWKEPLLSLLEEAAENKLRWNLALTVPRLRLAPRECVHTAAIFEGWLFDDRSSIVRTAAMQGIADLCSQHPQLLPAAVDHLRYFGRTGTAAMRTRSRILLKKLEKPAR